jgi:hypothetical protein
MFFPFKARSSAERQRDARLTPAKHVVSTMHGSRTVLLDSRSGRYYGLDEVGSRIWSLAQAGFAPSSIAEKLAEEYEASSEQLGKDVQTFLANLRHSHLLEDQ